MNAYFSSKSELKDLINKAVRQTVNEALPAAIHKATRKQILTTDDVMELLSLSRRSVQHLRDSGQLAFSQNAPRTIRYHIDDVEAYLNGGKVEEVQK